MFYLPNFFDEAWCILLVKDKNNHEGSLDVGANAFEIISGRHENLGVVTGLGSLPTLTEFVQ